MPIRNRERGVAAGLPSAKGGVNWIDPSLARLAVPIASLTPDPKNARLHPERSIQVLEASLLKFGQRKPIVVRKRNRVVVAGNGLLEAAKRLGWTQIAASIQEMTDSEAISYGLADNRTAEMSIWDLEVVAELEKFLGEEKSDVVGWSEKELLLLRMAVWPSGDDGSTGREGKSLTYLACPYSHKDEKVRKRRVEVASRIAGRMIQEGQLVYSPLTHGHFIMEQVGLPADFSFWREMSCKLLGVSDTLAVVMLEGWRESPGVSSELRFARKKGLPISYLPAGTEEV